MATVNIKQVIIASAHAEHCDKALYGASASWNEVRARAKTLAGIGEVEFLEELTRQGWITGFHWDLPCPLGRHGVVVPC